MVSASPPGMGPCACPDELGSAQVLGGALFTFAAGIPAALAAAAAAGYSASKAALWSALVAAAGVLAAAAAAVARPVAAGAAHLAALLCSHALLVLGSLAAFIAWQIYYPSRFLIRAASRLSRLRGVTLELPPAPDAPAGAAKYVALTIDDGPCPYHTTAALDALKEAGARATFFITGYHVEECDFQGVGCTLSGGDGLYLIGSEALKRMAMEGHELANHGWSATPTAEVPLKQLAKELADTHKLLATARHTAMMDLTDGSDANALAANAAVAALAHSRTKWFRPVLSQESWFTPALVEALQKLGYSTVLGSVWPWDSFVRSPLLNALYVVTKAYSGAIIVLHDRNAALVPTLQYALPWLRWLGYDVVTLSEAAHRSNNGTPELTPAALDLHNLVHDPPSSVAGSASVAGKSTDSSNGQHIVASSAYLARMAKERERAATQNAVEEAEKLRIKAAKRAEADRRAGINRELANMSAADKRGIERREREKKEAEIRRIKRKEEEARERERYEAYMKERAIKAARDEAARVEARRKAEEDAQRKRDAEEEFRQRQEAERRVAAEMVLRQRAEAALAKAGITSVLVAGTASALAAAGSSDGGATGASDNGDSGDGSSASGEQQQGKVKKGLGLLRRLGSKTALKLMGSGKNLSAADAGTDDGEEAEQAAMEPQPAAQVPEESYAWYGEEAEPAAEAKLARINAAVAAHAAGAALPPPVTGSYALGPCNRVLLGFDGRPLLVAQAGKGISSATVLLDSAGERLLGPQGEAIVMLLDANAMPLVDPHGRPVFVAEEPATGRLLGVHPDGTIVRVPPYTPPTPPASISDASPDSGSRSSRHRRSSSRGGSGSHQRSSSGHRGSSSRHHTSSSSSGHRRSGSHGASHSRSAADLREQQQAQAQAQAAADAAVPAAAASSGQSEITPLPDSSSPAKAGTTPGAAPAAAAKAAVDKSKWVPAQLLTGPSGKPLLGLDNRPLIVAVDAQGVPLVECPNGETLLGPFGAPIKLGVTSDGSLVALDNLCRPLQGADCAPRVVALNKRGRPLVDEEGRAITLSVGPTGVIIPDTPPTPAAAPPPPRTSGAAALPRVPGAAAAPSRPVAPPPTPAAPRESPFSFSKPAAVTSAAGAGLVIGGRQGAAPFAAAPAALQVPAAAADDSSVDVARTLSFGASTPDGSDAVRPGSDGSPQSTGRTHALGGSTEGGSAPFVFEKVQLGHGGLQLTATTH